MLVIIHLNRHWNKVNCRFNKCDNQILQDLLLQVQITITRQVPKYLQEILKITVEIVKCLILVTAGSWKIYSQFNIKLYCSLDIMKKFVELMLCFHWLRSSWRRADNFLGVTCRQESDSFVYKHRQTGEAKTKVYIFVYKIFTNNLFKNYTAIAAVPWKSEAIVRWRRFFLFSILFCSYLMRTETI